MKQKIKEVNMVRHLSIALVIGLSLSLLLAGCAQERAASSKEAIETAKTLETVQQKADYLISQAKAFYNSNEFQQAVDIAQHILRYVDRDSQEAKNLLEKARAALASAAKGAVEDVKQQLPGFGQ
jgi:hypothetical protein